MDKQFYKSKKFLGACLGLVSVLGSSLLGLPEAIINDLGSVVIAYLAGQSVVDSLSVLRGLKLPFGKK